MDVTVPSVTVAGAIASENPIIFPAEIFDQGTRQWTTYQFSRSDIFDLLKAFFGPATYTPVTGTASLAVNKKYAVSGTSTLSLPSGAANGSVVEVSDHSATASAATPVTVGITGSEYIFDGQGNVTTVTFTQRGFRAFFIKDTAFGSSGRWICTVLLPPNSAAMTSVRPPQVLTISSGAAVWDVRSGANATLTLTEDVVLGFPVNAPAGSSGVLLITQDGTGGRTLTFDSQVSYTWVFPNSTAPTITSAANKKDILNWWTPDGTTFYTSTAQNFF